MLSNPNYSEEIVAQSMHYMRRQMEVYYKNATPWLQRQIIYGRNYLQYGDKLGPGFNQLLQRGKSFKDIINSASRIGGKNLGL